MLDIEIKITGDKIVIRDLQKFNSKIPSAVKRGLTKASLGVFTEAHRWLSGAGAKASNVSSGGYPVPVRTGHLRRSLRWLSPGKSKTFRVNTKKRGFTQSDSAKVLTGPLEAKILNIANYADDIHEGKGSSAKFGKRPYLADAFERFNRGSKIQEIIEKEIDKIIPR